LNAFLKLVEAELNDSFSVTLKELLSIHKLLKLVARGGQQ